MDMLSDTAINIIKDLHTDRLDYQAKKIAEIFKTYIQPKIKEILMEE